MKPSMLPFLVLSFVCVFSQAQELPTEMLQITCVETGNSSLAYLERIWVLRQTEVTSIDPIVGGDMNNKYEAGVFLSGKDFLDLRKFKWEPTPIMPATLTTYSVLKEDDPNWLEHLEDLKPKKIYQGTARRYGEDFEFAHMVDEGDLMSFEVYAGRGGNSGMLYRVKNGKIGFVPGFGGPLECIEFKTYTAK